MSVKCSNCGTQVDTDANQCAACGAVFSEPSLLDRFPSSWIGASVGVLVVVVLLALKILPAVETLGLGAAVALIVWILSAFVS